MKVVGPALSFPTNKKSQLMRSRTQVIVKIQNSVRMSIMLEKLNQGPTKTQTTNIIQINSIKHKKRVNALNIGENIYIKIQFIK